MRQYLVQRSPRTFGGKQRLYGTLQTFKTFICYKIFICYTIIILTCKAWEGGVNAGQQPIVREDV